MMEKIEDKKYIANLLNNLYTEKEVPVSIRQNGSQYYTKMVFSYKKDTGHSILINKDDSLELKDEKFEVTFFRGEEFFTFESTIIESLQYTYKIQKSYSIFTSFKRFITRFKIGDIENAEAFIKIPNLQKEYRIIDISTGGLSFETSEKIFDKDETIRNAFLEIKNLPRIYVDCIVKHYKSQNNNTFTYKVAYIGMKWESYQQLFKFIFKNTHSNLKSLNEFSHKEIFNLYSLSKYNNIISNQDLESSSLIDTIKLFDNLKNKPMLSLNFAYFKNDSFLSLASTIRVYNRTFLAEQLLSPKNIKISTGEKVDIYISLAEALLNHPYCEYYLSYINDDLLVNKEIFNSIEKLINDKDKFIIDTLESYTCNISKYTYEKNNSRYSCEVLDMPDSFIQFCKSNLSDLEIKTYNYADTFDMDEIKQVFQTADFSVSRKLWVISEDGIKIAFAVAESYTNCINNDNCRIYFANNYYYESREELIASLIPELVTFYDIDGKSLFNIYLNSNSNLNKEIFLSGIKCNGSILRIIMNRKGLAEYKKLLVANPNYYSKYYNLTYPQKLIWYSEKVYQGTSLGNNAGTIRIKGDIDYALFERAINICIKKNDSLRIRLLENENEPVQYISEFKPYKVDFIDFSTRNIGEFYQWEEEMAFKPFSIIDSELIYFALAKISENEGAYYCKFHHTITDGWSLILIANQIFSYYYSLLTGAPILDENEPSYMNYINNEIEFELSEKFLKQKQFWNDKFKILPEFIRFKEKNISYINTKSNRKSFVIPKDMSENIRSFCEVNNTSPFTLFMSILYTYIWKVTSKIDISIGTTLLNRSGEIEKRTVGMFVNVVPVRLKIDKDFSFKELVKNVGQELKLVLKNQKYPYLLLKKDVKEMHNINTELFDIGLNYHNAKFEPVSVFDDYKIRWHQSNSKTNSLDIHVSDRGNVGEYVLNFDYLEDIYSEHEIQRMYENMSNLLFDAIQNADKNINELEMISSNERHKVLFEFNNTDKDFAEYKTIHQLFEKQVEKTPYNIAIVFENKQITYQELNYRANKLAYTLRYNGVNTETIIAIMLERSIDMVVGILGILKAGGAILPIDFEYPKERINFMLNDSKTDLLLTKTSLDKGLEFHGDILYLDKNDTYSDNNSNLENITKADDLLYIIYTSGTTGLPKGTMLKHKNLSNLILFERANTNIDFCNNVLQFTTLTFDVCYQEIFSTLLNGGNLFIINNDDKKDINNLFKFIKENEISIVFLPTAYLMLITSNIDHINKIPDTIKHIITAGEKLIIGKLFKEYIKTSDVFLHNHYGPSETHVATTLTLDKSMEIKDVPSIGKPISNTKIYILDENKNILPIGVKGELYISGDGVGSGYLNNADLTASKFIQDPFSESNIMYRTGDISRWLENGEIEYIERIDSQVKIRGHRIELSELEICLLAHKDIKEAVVLAKEFPDGKKYLCAYIVVQNVCDECRTLNIDIKEYLLKKLPAYMIPSYFIQLTKMPLTSNNKIDKMSLLKIEVINEDDKKYQPPTSNLERSIIELWQETFKTSQIGINDNFFDLGGDSLNATIFISSISKKLNKSIPLKLLFEFPTVKALAEAIKNIDGEKLPDTNICNLEIENPVPLNIKSLYIKIENDTQKFEKYLSEKLANKFDSAALCYLPNDLYSLFDSNSTGTNDTLFTEPKVISVLNTEFGIIGLISIPIFERELYSNHNKLLDACKNGIKLAERFGAKVVSLTGLIPSATNYGKDILEHLLRDGISMPITTGHATTAAAVLLSLIRLLEESNCDISKKKVCVLGLGSIGKTVLRLGLRILPHPKSLILCDLYEKNIYLEEFKSNIITDFKYPNNILIACANNHVIPDAVYEADIIIGATNVPEILEIDKLNPGTLIIDDSSPHCFSKDKAINRLNRYGDILFTEGGIIESSKCINKTTFLPKVFEQKVFSKFIRQFTEEKEITGCILSSILSAKYEDLKPIVGTVDDKDAYLHFKQLDDLKYRGAPLHCDDYFLSYEFIMKFTQKFGCYDMDF